MTIANDLAVFSGGAGGVNAGGFIRNRIINGAMVIDQRNAGAAITAPAGYFRDRWKTTNTNSTRWNALATSGGVTPPAGFTNYLGVQSAGAYSVVSGDTFNFTQSIEGFNVADFGFGAAGAASITVSFWVRSSLTGTFCGSLQNSAQNRSYVFTFTVNSANTWEQKTVTVVGDTSGTWLTTNGAGLLVNFNLGSGSTFNTTAGSWQAGEFYGTSGQVNLVATNGATFYITGVQLEVGSVATPFEREIYSNTLAKCQRYYETSFPIGTAPANSSSFASNYNGTQLGSTSLYVAVCLKASKRTTPSVVIYSGNNVASPTANQLQFYNNAGSGWTNTTGATAAATNDNSFYVSATTSGTTAGYSYFTTFGWTASAEL